MKYYKLKKFCKGYHTDWKIGMLFYYNEEDNGYIPYDLQRYSYGVVSKKDIESECFEEFSFDYPTPIKLINAIFYPSKDVTGYIHKSACLDNNTEYNIKFLETNLPNGIYEIKIEANTVYQYFVLKVRDNKFKVIWFETKLK